MKFGSYTVCEVLNSPRPLAQGELLQSLDARSVQFCIGNNSIML